MGKSRAEIQRAYRQRLKERNNEEYLRKERERFRQNYTPSSALSENDRRKRNEKNKEKLRRFYQRKRAERASKLTDTSGYESDNGPSTSDDRGRLRVKVNFPNKRNGAIKRWKREASDARSRIRILEQERDNAVTKYRSAQRSLQRLKKSQSKDDVLSESEMTPRKQTEEVMKQANLTSDQRQKLKKPLLLGNVLISELKETKIKTPKSKMDAIHNIASGKVTKKYRVAKLLSKRTGLCRHKLGRDKSKEHQIERRRRMSKVKRYRSDVEQFMKREDNSRMQPGKSDAKRIKKGEKIQTHVLTDYLTNLYNKFKSENPNINISFTSFCRSRPKYILTAAFSSRSSCLCTKHQNASLTVKALRKIGLDISVNPEKAVNQIPGDDTIKEAVGESITFGQWTRVEVEDKGRKKCVTKIVEKQLESEQFVEHVKKQFEEFDGHVNRVRTQYEQIRLLKENLPGHEIILQLDFAENYSCKSLEEVQSAYFNQTMVTLHPIVAYFRREGELQHKSFVVVSDEMSHKPSTIIAFIDDIMPHLKDIDNDLKSIHYWSDSPTSQYRNKYMFDFVANHFQRYGVMARWNYFEAGHGKGPCDGIGGTCKRLADEAMRSGKVIIQDPQAYFDWAIKSSMASVTFKFVSTSKCAEVEKQLEKGHLKPIKGTMKLHSVVGLGDSKVKVRDVSCYCVICISGQTCSSWRDECLTSHNSNREDRSKQTKKRTTKCASTNQKPTGESRVSIDEEQNVISNTHEFNSKFQVNDFVGAVYDGRWFIGKIVDIDDEEEEIEITFMKSRKQLYQWPAEEDKIWVDNKDILCKVDSPVATGKSQRMYKLTEKDNEIVVQSYKVYMEKFRGETPMNV